MTKEFSPMIRYYEHIVNGLHLNVYTQTTDKLLFSDVVITHENV